MLCHEATVPIVMGRAVDGDQPGFRCFRRPWARTATSVMFAQGSATRNRRGNPALRGYLEAGISPPQALPAIHGLKRRRRRVVHWPRGGGRSPKVYAVGPAPSGERGSGTRGQTHPRRASGLIVGGAPPRSAAGVATLSVPVAVLRPCVAQDSSGCHPRIRVPGHNRGRQRGPGGHYGTTGRADRPIGSARVHRL